MGKLILSRNEKKMLDGTLIECYLNNQLIYKLRNKQTKTFNIDNGIYEFYCTSKACTSASYIKKLDLSNKNIKVDISEGFIRPNIEISYIDTKELESLESEELSILNENYNSNNNNIDTTKKKKEPLLVKIICSIIGIFLIIGGINLSIDGTKTLSGQNNSTSEKYSYTINNQGIDENGFYKISGTVVNNTDKDVDGLQIEFKCYDKDGNSIDTAKAYTENLLAGETWSYEAIDTINANNINHCTFYQITPYTTLIEFK